MQRVFRPLLELKKDTTEHHHQLLWKTKNSSVLYREICTFGWGAGWKWRWCPAEWGAVEDCKIEHRKGPSLRFFSFAMSCIRVGCQNVRTRRYSYCKCLCKTGACQHASICKPLLSGVQSPACLWWMTHNLLENLVEPNFCRVLEVVVTFLGNQAACQETRHSFLICGLESANDRTDSILLICLQAESLLPAQSLRCWKHFARVSEGGQFQLPT